MSSFVLRGAVFADDSVADVLVADGRIVEIGNNLQGDEVIDCTGLRLLPGFVDLHTHLREPGFEASETVLTGSQSAALGGYTAVHAMANTNPVADNAAVVEMVRNLGARAGYVEVFPIGAVTKGLEGAQMAELGLMNQSQAQVKVFSDDGKCVSDALVMKRALEYVKSFDGVIAQHAQEPKLTDGSQMNDSELSAVLGLKGWPAVAEESIIARDVLLAEHTGARLHICHLSTAGSVEVIRWAKSRGISVTAEVTPHHLMLTEQLVSEYNPLYKVNPPLRKQSDVLALREALIDGTIDIIATDHAPHAAELKDCEFSAAAFGMVGLETAAAVAQNVLIESGRSNWQRLAEVMSHNPARIGRDENQGEAIAVGAVANLTLIDAEAVRTIAAQTASKSSNNPYQGLQLKGKVVHTIYRGQFTVRNSELQKVVSA
jgi:dihydroorotase